MRAGLRAVHVARTLRWLHAFALSLHSRRRPKPGLGQTRLDNNLVKNAVRPTAVGKKNGRFVSHPDAGQRSAILYSVIVSCLRHGVEPLAYLRDVLARLPSMTNQDDLGPRLPSRWRPRS